METALEQEMENRYRVMEASEVKKTERIKMKFFCFSTVKQDKSEYGKRLKTGWSKLTARLGLERFGVFTFLRYSDEIQLLTSPMFGGRRPRF